MKKIYNLLKINAGIVATAILFFNINTVTAQAWQWANGGGGTASDNASKTCIDPTGNVYVAGTFNSASIQIGTITVNNSGVGFDAYVAKYNPAGVPIWAARIGGSANEGVAGICCDAIGRVYINGTYSSPFVSIPPMTYTNIGSGTNQVYVACFDASGVVQWLNGYGGTGNEYAGGIAYSNAISMLYFTGTFEDPTLVVSTTTLTNSSLTGKKDAYLIKLNSFGTFQWALKAGSASCDDWSYGVAVDGTGSPAMFGTFSGSVLTPTTTIGSATLTSYGNQDIWIGKYNSSNTFQWARNLGSSGGGDYSGGIDVDASNNFFVSGYYQGTNCIVGTTTLTAMGGYDAFIAKYNTSGTAQWAQKAGGVSDDYSYDLSVDGNGNPYMMGWFTGTVITVGTTTLSNYTPGPSSDIFLAKYNTSGTVQWAAKAGGPGNEIGSSCAADAVGNVYAVGSIGGFAAFDTYTMTNIGGSDLFAAKIGCLTTSVSGVSSVCQGSSVSLTASGATTYSWSTGATTASISVSPTISTNYTVTGTSGGCVGTPATFSVTFLPASLGTTSSLNLLCKQKVAITTTCSPTATAVSWSPSANLSSATVLSPTVTAQSTMMTYVVTATLSNGCVQSGISTVSSYAQTPDICQVTVDSLGNNNEIYWEKTLYPQADSFIVYRETSTNVYTRIAGVSRTLFSMYVDTNRSIGPFNGNPNLTYYKYKLRIKDSCGNVSPMSLWHETIFVQDQLNGNFNWNSYAIESSTSTPVTSYNLKRRDISTGTETLVVSTGGNLATDPAYNSVWPTNIKWFVDALGFNCVPTAKIMLTKTKTKSNQSNDKLFVTGLNNSILTNSIRIFPNPANDVLNIDLNGLPKQEMNIEIQNALGQLIYTTRSLNQYLVINTSDFAGGIYIINIKQNDKLIAVKKLVIEK